MDMGNAALPESNGQGKHGFSRVWFFVFACDDIERIGGLAECNSTNVNVFPSLLMLRSFR